MQSTLLEAGSCSTKLRCIGDGKRVPDWTFVRFLVDGKGSLLLPGDNVGDAAALRTLEASTSSAPDLLLPVKACLFGGGDIDLSLDDWNAS